MAGLIHIACQADARFAPDCAVMLHSLFTANPEEHFEIHFLHQNQLVPAELDALAQLTRGLGQRWTEHRLDDADLKGFAWVPHYGGHAAWYRLFLHRLLPAVTKVLYLDADLLIVDRIRPLWETPLKGKCVAAVTNSLFKSMEERVQFTLGLPDGDHYFNSGVLLLHLDELRRSGLGDRVIALACSGDRPLPWPDQDALNAVLWPHCVRLAPRWNAMNALWELPARYLAWTETEIKEARDRPAIVHFVGPYKPLHYRNRHPLRARYLVHLRQTPWKERTIHSRTLRHMLLRLLPTLWQWRIESGELMPRQLLRRWLRPQSQLGALLRDAYRLLTPMRARPQLEQVLEAFAYSRDSVFFIQVGSNDANHGDPLRRYVLSRDWRGIMIEPVPYVFARLRQNYASRQGLMLENIAIAPSDGTADFYSLAQTSEPLPIWYDQLGSFSLNNILKHAAYIPKLRERIMTLKVPCLTFESLCRKHGVERIDLIHIDAEGYDYEIIKLVDLDLHQPTALLFEHKHLGAADHQACREHLRAHGYDLLQDEADTLALRHKALSRPWSRLARAWKLAQKTKSMTQHSTAAP